MRIILLMSVDEASELLSAFPRIAERMGALREVGTVMRGVDVAEFGFRPFQQSYVERNDIAVLSGGANYYHDGVYAGELCPQVFPERPYYRVRGVGNVVGAHLWTVIYSWEDARGNVHRSFPSPPLSYAPGAPGEDLRIYFPTLTLTEIDGVQGSRDWTAELYRTEAGGSVFHLVAAGVPILSGSAAAVAEGEVNPVRGLSYFADNLSDPDIASRAVLYTDGNVLGNECPPASRATAIVKDRMFLASAERPNEVWASKPLEPFVAPEFSATQVLDVAEGDGPITAFGVLDDKIVIFKESDIFVIVGDGPNAQGQGTPFSLPQRVSSDVGAVRQSSVANGSFGVVFQSRKGIYRLDRGLQLTYIGFPVADVVGFNAIRSATVLEDDNLVVFSVDTGTAVAWNYLYDRWASWTNHAVQTATLWQNRLTWMTATGRGRRQNVSGYADRDATTDAALFIAMRIVTPWIKLGQVQGFKRLWKAQLLGDHVGTANIRVRVGYDYADAYTDSRTWTDAEVLAVRYHLADASATRFELGVFPTQQKIEAARFEFLAQQSSGSTSAGYRLVNLVLIAGMKGRMMPLPATANK